MAELNWLRDKLGITALAARVKDLEASVNTLEGKKPLEQPKEIRTVTSGRWPAIQRKLEQIDRAKLG